MAERHEARTAPLHDESRPSPQAASPDSSPNGEVVTSPWPSVPFAEARARLARGVVVYRPGDVADMIDRYAADCELEAERRAAAVRAGVVTLWELADEATEWRVRAETARRISEQTRTLADGDVTAARALYEGLRSKLGARGRMGAAAHAACEATEYACRRVRDCLVPRCVVWYGYDTEFRVEDLELLARVMAGVRDTRAPLPEPVVMAAIEVRAVGSANLRRWMAEDEAGRAPWERPVEGVLMFRPGEVADLLRVEADRYMHAGESLLRSHAHEGLGLGLRELGRDLAADAIAVRRLRDGDVDAARAMLVHAQREMRKHARAARRVTKRHPVEHLAVLSEFLEELLLPLPLHGPKEPRTSHPLEIAVERRWEAGLLDVRDAVRYEAERIECIA